MADVAEGGGGGFGPKHDRKVMRRYLRALSKPVSATDSNPFKVGKLRKLNRVIENSKALGNFTPADERLLNRVVSRVNSRGAGTSQSSNHATGAAQRQIQKLTQQGNRIPRTPPASAPGGVAGQPKAPKHNAPPVGNGGPGQGEGVYKTSKNPRNLDNNPNNDVGKGSKADLRARRAHRRARNGGGRAGGNTSQPGMGYSPGTFDPNSKRTRRSAGLIVDKDINSQVQDLLNELKRGKRAEKFDNRKTNSEFKRTKGDLNYIFKEVADYMGNQNKKIAGRFDTSKADLQSQYGNLQSAMRQNSNSAESDYESEQRRLGIQKSANSRFDEDRANNSNVAATGQTNVLANLEAQKSASGEVSGLLNSMNAGSRGSAVGQAINSRQNSLSETREGYNEGYQEVLAMIRKARSERGANTNELAQSMEQNAFQQWAETNQMNFTNQLSTNNFNLDVSKMNSDNLFNKAKLRQESARAATERRLIAAETRRQNAGIFNIFGGQGAP